MKTTILAGAVLVLAAASAESQALRTIRYPAVAPTAIVALTNPVLTILQDGCELNGANGVVIQQSGGIVVANAGDRVLCFFDGTGRLVKKAGRRGAGPGEFESMGHLSLYRADSVTVTDAMQRRISIFGSRGEVGRQFLVRSPDTLGSHNTTLALPSGDFLLAFAEIKTMAPRKEAVVIHQQFFRAAGDGTIGQRLVRLVIGEHFVQALRPEDGMGPTAYWGLQWGRSTSISAKPSGFLYGDGGDNIIREADASGRVLVEHVTPLARRAVTPDLIARYKDATVNGAKPERRAVMERMTTEMPYPREMPAHGRIIADHSGPIWVESYPDSSGSYWLRLDPATVTAKAYRFPDRFRLHAVRSDRACGIGRDADDLQTVYCFSVPR
jgi:hypothetical protein